jgi:uncharacterized protein
VKRSILIFAACLAFASPNFAQQSAADAPASKEDIQRYLDTMHVRDMMTTVMDSMTKSMHQMVHQMVEKQPNLPADFELRVTKMTDDMLKDLPIDELLDAMVPVYEKHLTKGDVDALIAFYSGPTGQKILKEMPAMTSEAMQAASGVTQKMMTKMMERVQTEIAQMQKEQEGSSTKPNPSTQN